MSDERPAPAGVNPSQPNSARVFDYLLGGKDNYEADRAVAQRMLEVAPDTRTLAWISSNFLVGATRLAAEAGIRQFIDLGAGIPTSPSVYEVAHEIDPTARVASVDFDPVVFAHANAMLDGEPDVVVMQGDVRRPRELIERLRTEARIDFDEPVAVLAVGVLHYVMDDEDPAGVVAAFREVMAPGSYLGFTHGSTETADEFASRTADDTDGSPSQCAYRTPPRVASFFDGFEMLDPGIAPIQKWLGEGLPQTGLVLLGGICTPAD